MRQTIVQIAAGMAVALLGAVWILQGFDLLGQEGGMNGQAVWAVVGLPLLVGGVLLARSGVRARRRR